MPQDHPPDQKCTFNHISKHTPPYPLIEDLLKQLHFVWSHAERGLLPDDGIAPDAGSSTPMRDRAHQMALSGRGHGSRRHGGLCQHLLEAGRLQADMRDTIEKNALRKPQDTPDTEGLCFFESAISNSYALIVSTLPLFDSSIRTPFLSMNIQQYERYANVP